MIDVLLSARNAEKYIAESIGSVLTQTFKDFTLYIIDDASTDQTVEIIKSFQDPRIKFFQNNEKHGLTANLNFLLKQGKSEFVARQDADDVSNETRFEKELKYLNNNQFDVVGSDADLIDEQNRIIGEIKYFGQNFKHDMFLKNIFVHTSVLMKRKAIESAGGYPEDLLHNEDYYLWLLLLKNHRFGIISEKLVKFRIHKKSVSYKNMKLQQLNGIKARFEAIRKGIYPISYLCYLIPVFFSYILPLRINQLRHQKIYGYKQ